MMMSPLQPPDKEVDVEFLVFVERYATDLLKWDILAFFANNADTHVAAATIADEIGRNVQSVQPELGNFVLLSILHQTTAPNGLLLYQLTTESYLRRMTLKFANQLTSRPSY